jgi:signal transduction histidine kinase
MISALPVTSNRGMLAVNAVLAVLFAAVLAAEAGNLAADHRNITLDCLTTLVVCAAAVLRERSRAWAAVIGLAVAGAAEAAAALWHLPGQPGIAATLALFVLTGSALRVLPSRIAAAIAVGAAAVAIAETHTHPAGRDTIVLGWAITACVALGLRFWLPFRVARHEAAVETVRRAERLELARELHDAAAHHLTGIVIQAQAARIAARASAEALDTALAGIESGGAEALAAMRQVIGLLRDTQDTDGLTPGPPQLTDLVQSFGTGAGPGNARLDLPDGPADPAWPPELTSTLYRVVQEALTNITRHAPGARAVVVTLAHDEQAITVEITDDAPAPAARFPHASGYGLIGLRERVEALGGNLSAGAKNEGWSVRATLPGPR